MRNEIAAAIKNCNMGKWITIAVIVAAIVAGLGYSVHGVNCGGSCN